MTFVVILLYDNPHKVEPSFQSILHSGTDEDEARRIASLALLKASSSEFVKVQTWKEGKLFCEQEYRERPSKLCQLLQEAREEIDGMNVNSLNGVGEPKFSDLLKIRQHIKIALYAALYLPKQEQKST